MTTATPDADELAEAWRAAQARLPDGWTLEGLRCASTGLTPGQRSEDWVAVATGPSGEEQSHRAGDPGFALEGLVRSIGMSPGS